MRISKSFANYHKTTMLFTKYFFEILFSHIIHLTMKQGSSVVSILAFGARGPRFDPRQQRGKFGGPNSLPFVSFAGMT